MKILPFKSSPSISLGVELEFQIVDPVTFDLISRAKELIRNVKNSPYAILIKPEVTQSMIEINSSIHHSIHQLHKEFLAIHSFLEKQKKPLGICFSGGGTHPFQKWVVRKIFPTQRFKNLSRKYRFLSKRSVYGQHIHVGCKSGEEAIYLTHALSRYVPQFIAISASSPFYQGIDTGFHSCRPNLFNVFPTSGVMPYLTHWKQFSDYFYKMRHLGIIKTMKDVYWDIRPKPEFGTVEIRVFDTPLSIKKAMIIAAYVHGLSTYLLEEKPFPPVHDLYFVYDYNHFQACRYGLKGKFINPYSLKEEIISSDILNTLNTIKKYSRKLNITDYITQLKQDVLNNHNDSTQLRNIYKKTGSFSKVVREQCKIWAGEE